MSFQQEEMLASLGVHLDVKQKLPIHKEWICYSLNHLNPSKDIPIILIESGPKTITEIKKQVKNHPTCIVFFEEKNVLFFKSQDESHITTLENDSEYQRISSILRSTGIADAQDAIDLDFAIKKLIDKIPNATSDFVTKGLFSTHYLRSRIFDDTRQNVNVVLEDIKEKIGDTKELLQALGWDVSNSSGLYCDGTVSITVTDQDDFSTREKAADIAPSYTAVATLRESQWAILTNGRKWRLYSSKVSASSTNYFEIVLDPEYDNITKYLIMLFGFHAFRQIDGKTDVDRFLEGSENYTTGIQDDLSEKILSADGLFLDIVKGVLDHDMKKIFTSDELEEAKQVSLRIMYRVWFLAYAESRNLLPTSDKKYRPISLQSIRNKLDSYETDPKKSTCWSDLLVLFDGIRNGSIQHNLPQYNGALFSHNPSIDDTTIQNNFIVLALRGMLEKDGESLDYASLGVRHLGHIFESLMEFGIHQAEKDLMLLVDKDGVKEVNTSQQSNYSYKKNDLYLTSKSGIASRKTSASFYTPNKIVEFLVQQGLEPIFEEREKLIGNDLKKYQKTKNEKNLQTCMNRLLDIQVLDPSMGSGHFLVEVLNKITTWATDILKRYPAHPLLSEIESDRQLVLDEQKRKGIVLDEHLLTHDVLLKRKIMKRCIFGVDLNPMAVELAKLSLWLDSFAIGVPLTYMDHHIKLGDSTIGMFLDDLKDKQNTTLDDWTPSTESNKMICDVISSSDVTVDQVHESQDKYLEHKKLLEPTRHILDALAASKINPKILPKKAKEEFIHQFGRYVKNESKDFTNTRRTVNELLESHRFFHWELEMLDAFTDSRKGFDLIVGNPPWETVKPYNDEFFTPYDPSFRSLKPNTKKKERIKTLCKDPKIKKAYELYKKNYKEKSAFYNTCEMQGVGDNDLWKLVLERTSNLLAQNGIISMIIPSQILSNTGATRIRQYILQQDILSLYVFENRKKIFPIISLYRFALLCIRNNTNGPDTFPAGFYLHYLESLYDNDKEKDKFDTLSKQMICNLSPNDYIIPEISGQKLTILEKLFQNDVIKSGLDGWIMAFSRSFDKANDAYLLLENGTGWPVFEGKNIHQYNHRWSTPEFTANKSGGLKRESKRRLFLGKHKEIHDSFRLVFRDITHPKNMRTVIATIIPSHTFHAHSLNSIIFKHYDKIIIDVEYTRKILYLCGILNSMTFDFTARSRIQIHLATILKSLPLPKHYHEEKITQLAAKLVVGTPEFEGLAESLRIPNISLTPAQRIEITAELDALVAHSYDLTPNEYETIIDSFNAFKENPALYDADEITWNNTNLKEFYGEMAKLALEYFKTISGEST